MKRFSPKSPAVRLATKPANAQASCRAQPLPAHPQGVAPEAVTEARASAKQATDAAPGRPPTPRQPGHRRPGQATDAAPARPPPPRQAGHRRRARQATRKGWPYYTRRLHKPYDTSVYSRATPCGWPAAACGGLWWPVVGCGWAAAAGGGLWWPVWWPVAACLWRPACGGLWRPVCGGLWWPVVAGLGGGLGVVREQLTLIFWQFHKNLPFFPLTFF